MMIIAIIFGPLYYQSYLAPIIKLIAIICDPALYGPKILTQFFILRITRVSAILDGLVKRVTVKTVPTSVPLMMVFVMVMASANVINVNATLLILVFLLNQTSVKLSNLVASNMHHVHNVHTMDF